MTAALRLLTLLAFLPGVAWAVRPDILLILVDDLGVNDVGYLGPTDIPTPNIDQLSTEGVRFDTFYSMPVCSPTRAALISGRYIQRQGMRWVVTSGSERGMPPGSDSIARDLGGAGYETYMLGKWHLGRDDGDTYHPAVFGYHHFFGFLHAWDLGGTPFFDPILRRDLGPPTTYPGHLTEILTDEAIGILSTLEPEDPPVFLNLSYFSPHLPNEAPQEWQDMFPPTERGRFSASVAHVDSEIGRLLSEIERETVVIFTSDNGGQFVNHPDGNPPFRGWKGALLEGGIRVPAIIRWEQFPPRITNEVGTVMDLRITMRAIAGVLGGASPGDGISLLPAMKGHPLPPRTLFWENHQWPGNRTFTWVVRDGDWKLLHRNDLTHLYNLADDPYEAVDLAGTFPDKLAELTALYRAFREDQAPFSYDVQSVNGDAMQTGEDDFAFGALGGLVELADQQFLNPMDGDLSAMLIARAKPIARTVDSFLLAKGNWRLVWKLDGRIEAVIEGQGAVSGPPVDLLQPTGIALSFAHIGERLGVEDDDGLLRIFVNGVLYREKIYRDRILRNADPVRVGNHASGNFSFFGAIQDLEFWNVSLTEEDLD